MAVRRIIMLGDETLRKVSKKVEVFDANLHQLLDDMKDTLDKAKGLGLAAPQVAVLKRVCIIIDGKGKLHEFVNPEIVKTSKKMVSELEGCLSVKINGKCDYKKVSRPYSCEVEFFDRNGIKKTEKFTGYTARAAMHEVDHLNGILFIDKADEE